jgi:hypothetical protein
MENACGGGVEIEKEILNLDTLIRGNKILKRVIFRRAMLL